MNKEPIAGAVMAAASRVMAHHLQRMDQALRHTSQLTLAAQVTQRQAAGGDVKDIPSAADRMR